MNLPRDGLTPALLATAAANTTYRGIGIAPLPGIPFRCSRVYNPHL